MSLKENAVEPIGNNSKTNKDEIGKEEIFSPNTVEINRARQKYWCIFGRYKNQMRDIDCLCCQEVATISEENFEENLCITMSKHFRTFFFEKPVLKMFWLG